MKFNQYIFLLALLAMVSCAKEPVPVHIKRLDRAMLAYRDAGESGKRAIADSLRTEISALFKVLGHPSAGKAELGWWSHGEEVSVFQPDVEKAYPDLSQLESTLGHIYASAAKEGLALDSVHFAAVVYGLPMPMVRVDSVMLIALNHYLGSGYPGYSHWEAYRRVGKDREMLPYDLAAAIVSTSYPMLMEPPAPTLLSNMLYEGALAEARMRLLPDPDPAKALGVTADDLEYMQTHLAEMWREMAQKKMIYDTNHLTSDRMLSGAPSSPLLGGSAPGRAGRFIGYSIVQAYLQAHPSTPLSQLLTPDFYAGAATLPASGFNPK